jgi:cytochrome c-type biogenesis protein CcmH
MKSGQKTKNTLFFFIMVICSSVWTSPAMSLTVNEITKDLTCTCGCNMVVGACEGSMECGPAKQITDKVAQLVNAGKTKDEIIQYFVQTKGERILAAPTKKGFNLTAWLLPFFAIVLGGLGLFAFLNRCLSSEEKDLDAAEDTQSKKSSDKKYLDQFEKELKTFEL